MSGVRSDIGPWTIVPGWLLDLGVSDRAIRLYGLLGLYADKETGKAFPSRKTISDRMGCSADSVDRAVKELIDVGALKRDHRFDESGGKRSNLYTVLRVRHGDLQSAAPPSRTDAAYNQNHVELEKPLAAAPQKKQERDEIWDKLEAVYGPVTNDNARGKRNKAVKLLRQSDASPAEITARASRYRTLYPDAAFTDMALANQWDNLGLVIPVIDEQAGVRAMEEREAAERKAEETYAVSPEEAAVRAKALLDHLKGNS